MSKIGVEHTKTLVKTANELLSIRDYQEVLSNILVPYNNYHSGWTESVDQIFHEPQNDEERELSDQLTEIIKKTIMGLLDEAMPTAEIYGYATLEYIAVFLYRLGKRAPSDLIHRTRELIIASQQLGAPEMGLISTPSLEILSRIHSQ